MERHASIEPLNDSVVASLRAGLRGELLTPTHPGGDCSLRRVPLT